MSRGSFGNDYVLKATPSSQSVRTSSAVPSPNQSTSSFSSQETIKASKFNTKAILKELVGGGGNNQSVPKLPKSERVYASGRGGARKGPRPPAHIGPSNAEKLDALLANSNHRRGPESLAPETATVSSFATSFTGSSESGHSNTTVRRAIREVLGGGGNEHGLWKNEPGFIRSYGRGGSYRSPTVSSSSSRAPLDIEILSEGQSDSSSLSVARNAHGLFFFGRGHRSSEDASDTGSFLVVGPGEGIFHPSADATTQPNLFSSDSALTRSSMHKSGMSKISVKVAAKEVLGGGGNDDGEWKYIDVFYPGYGRGGEGARCSNSIRDLYHIFYPCPHYTGKHYWYHNPNHPRTRRDSDSTLSFPSISSDTSSICAPSTSSRRTSWMSSNIEDEGDTCSSWSIAQPYLGRSNDHLARLAHHDLASSNQPIEDGVGQNQSLRAWFTGHPTHQDLDQVDLAGKGKGRAMSEGAETIHSPNLIDFRRALQEERGRREGRRASERTLGEQACSPGTFQSTVHQVSAETLATRSIAHVPPPPSLPPPSIPPTASIRYSYRGAYQQLSRHTATVLPVQLPPPTLTPTRPPAVLQPNIVACSLASALTLVQTRSEYIKNIQDSGAVFTPTQLDHEHEELRREREMLAVQLESMKKELLQREKTIEGLTWLVSNLPEHEGMQVIVDTGDSGIDDETMSTIREAEEELMCGDSRSILQLERPSLDKGPALPDSPPAVGSVP